MRRAAKVDANHGVIVTALRKCGCQVQSLAAVGKGVPDLLVERAGKLFLLEVKDGAKVPSARKLTPDEARFGRTWPVHVVLSPEDALRAVGFSDIRARVDRNARAVDAAAENIKALFSEGRT